MLITSPHTEIAVGDHNVRLHDLGTAEDSRIWALSIDGIDLGVLDFLKYYQTEGVASDDYLVLWGGSRIHIADVSTMTIRSFDRDDDVVAVHMKSPHLYICGETSAALFDPKIGKDLKRFLHDEIIIESTVRDDGLWIKDLSDRTMAVGF